MLGGIAVDLRRRREEKTRSISPCTFEGVVRAIGSDFERLDRQLVVVNRARRRREVQHAVNGCVDRNPVRDVGLDQPKTVVVGKSIDVAQGPSHQVVDADHFVAVAEESLAQMRAEEPGGAGNENSHDTVGRPIE